MLPRVGSLVFHSLPSVSLPPVEVRYEPVVLDWPFRRDNSHTTPAGCICVVRWAVNLVGAESEKGNMHDFLPLPPSSSLFRLSSAPSPLPSPPFALLPTPPFYIPLTKFSESSDQLTLSAYIVPTGGSGTGPPDFVRKSLDQPPCLSSLRLNQQYPSLPS